MIQSSRCLLRRFTKNDFENMRKLETEPEVVKFTSLRVPQTEQQTLERLQKTLDLQPSREPLGIWAVEHLQTQKFIGWIMLMPRELPYPELGYMIVPEFWGQGYASEITKCLINYAFEKLNIRRFSACTDLENSSSIKVLEKLGFAQIKIEIKQDATLGKACELKVFELTL